MKLTAPQVSPQLEPAHLEDVLRDGELEAGQLADEEAVNVSCAGLELDEVRIDKMIFIGAHLSRLNARDVIVQRSDLSSANLADGYVNRVRFDACRLTGTDLNKVTLHDVVFEGCKLDLANFRFAELRRVRFVDCTLRETDFLGARMHDVEFQRCELERVTFDQANVQKLDLRGSELTELSGWRFLKGTTIDSLQLVAIAPYLAHELGFTVRDV
jgi:uncharacterized protein YjbI with pentapeptide repeats